MGMELSSVPTRFGQNAKNPTRTAADIVRTQKLPKSLKKSEMPPHFAPTRQGPAPIKGTTTPLDDTTRSPASEPVLDIITQLFEESFATFRLFSPWLASVTTTDTCGIDKTNS